MKAQININDEDKKLLESAADYFDIKTPDLRDRAFNMGLQVIISAMESQQKFLESVESE